VNAKNSDRFKVKPAKLIEEKTTKIIVFFNARVSPPAEEVWLEAYFEKVTLCAAPTVILFPRHLTFIIYMLLKSYTVDFNLTFKF